MDVAIEPEPPEAVRRAIVAALAEVEDESSSAWWRAGIEEAVADARAQAGGPRSSAGAARAESSPETHVRTSATTIAPQATASPIAPAAPSPPSPAASA